MTSPRSLARCTVLAVVAGAAALLVAACGGDGSGGQESSPSPSATASAPAGAHNAADVAFAQQMIMHHQQAIEMAELAATRASSRDVKALAARIKREQESEIKTMSGWLTSWGEKVPEHMKDMHMPSHMPGTPSHMPGMMSSDDMDKLKKASGAAFDTLFLQMMIMHHRGAIEMAQIEKKAGEYGPAKELADSIIKTQSAEIRVMNKLLGQS